MNGFNTNTGSFLRWVVPTLLRSAKAASLEWSFLSQFSKKKIAKYSSTVVVGVFFLSDLILWLNETAPTSILSHVGHLSLPVRLAAIFTAGVSVFIVDVVVDLTCPKAIRQNSTLDAYIEQYVRFSKSKEDAYQVHRNQKGEELRGKLIDQALREPNSAFSHLIQNRDFLDKFVNAILDSLVLHSRNSKHPTKTRRDFVER